MAFMYHLLFHALGKCGKKRANSIVKANLLRLLVSILLCFETKKDLRCWNAVVIRTFQIVFITWIFHLV